MQIVKITTAALAAAVFVGVNAEADSISLNFSENSANQGFGTFGAQNIGPFSTDSANWNNSADIGSPGSGTMTNLIDDSGAGTGVGVTWSSQGTWFSGAGTANDDARLNVGYLDDGDDDGGAAGGAEPGDGFGVIIDFTGITYAQYDVTLLFASDQNAQDTTYQTLEFTVNGTGTFGGTNTATTYKNINDAFAATGNNWVDMAGGTVTGNYVTTSTSGSALAIRGQIRDGVNRGSIAGVIITEVPEPGSLALLGLGGLAVLRRRRG